MFIYRPGAIIGVPLFQCRIQHKPHSVTQLTAMKLSLRNTSKRRRLQHGFRERASEQKAEMARLTTVHHWPSTRGYTMETEQ